MPRGPEPKKPRPAWSTALRARRVALDLKQEDVAARTEDAISQGTVSDLERGKVDILNMTASRVGQLATALDWTLEEMQEALGVQLVYALPTFAEVEKSTLDSFRKEFGRDPFPNETYREAKRWLAAQAADSNKAVQSPLPAPLDRPLPDALHEAVQLYGKRFPELRDARWQQYLAGFNWREGQPDDPEAWLDLYRDLTRAGIVPGSN
ncbi:helix-turn-helix transcriptional regulator [Deinococcus sp. AB2017081]|nr:helix-turn-helix transcriptional regulator [Deinococcus sp. AB2017081]WQE97081.1 helix-turn-helix transcriptional regulator [Deinococcus sp. AB2017081]